MPRQIPYPEKVPVKKQSGGGMNAYLRTAPDTTRKGNRNKQQWCFPCNASHDYHGDKP